MATILVTKLYLPRLRPNIVTRPRLLERLNAGAPRKLTLIVAPAGFGKTTLISQWAEAMARPVAWLSLDAGEHDLTRFLMYLVAATQTVAPAVGGEALAALQSTQSPPTEVILTTLLNQISALPDGFTLVLDDYHLVDSDPINDALMYLIEHLPPQMGLVIGAREEPHLPLGRLRARDHLIELRAADLRFTAAEAAAFLNQVMGLQLTASDIARLAERTEGWIAGLQLAALAMQGRQDVSRFVETFAGDHRYIVDYLLEEVLQRQPEAIRAFLLETSILERLNGPLCDAVTEREGGAARLAALERGAFFVIPLDDQRQWYRYHHLFAEALQAHLRAERLEQVAELHLRASVWYERNGLLDDAIRHALAAGDDMRAADLIEMALPALQRNRQEVTTLGWLRALPDALIRVRPVLCVGYAWALLAQGELEGTDAWLCEAEYWRDATDRTRMVVANQAEWQGLPAKIAVYRAGYAQVMGDAPNTVKYARQLLELLPENEHLGRGAAAALLGLVSWSAGDLEEAYRMFADGMANVRQAGNIADVVGGAIALADIRIAQGRLRDAQREYERALQLSAAQGGALPGTADIYVGMAELCRERNDLDAASAYLARGEELSGHAGLTQHRHRWYVVTARLREAQGDLDGALDLLDEAERVRVPDFFPDGRPVAALRARVWIAQGRPELALDWTRARGLAVEDNLSYLREYEYTILARALLAQYQRDRTNRSALIAAQDLLERLRRAAEDGGRMGGVIEILALQALALHAQGDIPAVLIPLRRALTLAEPEGYARLFVDEGMEMAALLEEAAQRRIAFSYVSQLLAALRAVNEGVGGRQGFVEPLSGREIEVLRLLASDLSGPEIARELIVSLNTVRTHTKSIYSKLGVNNRRAAIRLAEELHLL